MLKYATCFICVAHAQAAAAAPEETCSTMGAPWFGASPTATPLELHRRGWGACALCGGAERLGAIVDDIDHGSTELLVIRSGDLTPHLLDHGLFAVTDAQHWQAQVSCE